MTVLAPMRLEERRRTFAARAAHLLAHPRSSASTLRARLLVFTGCVGIFVSVLLGELYLENNPTLQGFALLSILTATWVLPARWSSPISVMAALLPLLATYLGAIDPLTARFQVISSVVTGCLTEFTVRSILHADEERRELNAVLVRFTADAAHELRSPLTAIQSVAEVALSQPRDQTEYRRTLDVVLRSSQRLIRLSDALLLLASDDAGALTVAHHQVDLTDLVEEALDRWRDRAAQHGVTISGPAAPPEGRVAGDEVLLGRLLDNLIDNAVRHSPQGGRVGVDLSGTTQAGWTIIVGDSGPGFSDEFRPRAFERFSRAEQRRSRDGGGAGLGLPLCAAIASAHGGSINIDSSVTGARLRVWLPATRTSGGVQAQRSA